MLTIQDVLKNIIDAIQVILNSSNFQIGKGNELDSEFKKEIHNYIEDINVVLKTRIDGFSQPQLVQEKPHSTHKFLQAEKNDIHYIIQNLFILIKREDDATKLLQQGLYIINNLIRISETVYEELAIIEKTILAIAKIALPEMSCCNTMKDVLYYIESHQSHSIYFNTPSAINDKSADQIAISAEAVNENQSPGRPYYSTADIMRGVLYSLVTILNSSTNGQFLLLSNDKMLISQIKLNLKNLAARCYNKKTANDFSDIFNEVGLSSSIIAPKKKEQFSYAIDYILAHHAEIKKIIKDHYVKPMKTLLIIKLLLQSNLEIKGNINTLEEALVKFAKALSLMEWNDNNDFDTFYQKISKQKLQVDSTKRPALTKFIKRIEDKKCIDWINLLADSSLINDSHIQEPEKNKSLVNVNKELDGMLKAALTLLRSSELKPTAEKSSPSSGIELINKMKVINKAKKIESALGRDISNFSLDEIIERGALINQELTVESIAQINQVIIYLIDKNNTHTEYELLNEAFLLFQLVMNAAIKICGDVEIIKEGLLNAAKKTLLEAVNCDSFFSLLTIIKNVTSSKPPSVFQTTNISNPALFFPRSIFLDKTVCPVLPTIINNNTDSLIVDGADKALNNELAINGEFIKDVIVTPRAVKEKISRSQSSPSISHILTGLLHSLITIKKSSTNVRFLFEQDKRWLNHEINQSVKGLAARTSYSCYRTNNNYDLSGIFNEVSLSTFIIKPEKRKPLLQAIDFFLAHTKKIKMILKNHYSIPIRTLLILKLLLQSSQEIRGDIVVIEKALVDFLTMLKLPEGEGNTSFANFYQKISGKQFEIDLKEASKANDFFNKMQQIKFIEGSPYLAESELINNNDIQMNNLDLELTPGLRRETIEISNNNNYIDIDNVKETNTNNNNRGNTYLLHNYFDGDVQEPASKKRCLNTHKELNEMLDAILTLLRSSELRMIPEERFRSFRTQLINTINKIESALGRDGNNFSLDEIIERGILTNQELTAEDIGQINQVIIYLIDQNNKHSNDELLNEAFLLTSLIINEPMNIGGNLAIIQIGLLNAAKAILPEKKNCDSFSSLIAEINSVALSTTVNGFRLSNLISQAGFFNASNMNDTGSKTFENETLNKEATIDSQLRSSQ